MNEYRARVIFYDKYLNKEYDVELESSERSHILRVLDVLLQDENTAWIKIEKAYPERYERNT